MAVVPWVQPFPTGWHESTNGGVSYNPSQAATVTNEVVGPTGTQRFRVQFTIPANVSGTWFVTVSGDIYDGSVNQPAHLYYDAVDQGAVSPLAGPRTYTLPVVPGAHTLELWIGQADSTAGLTQPAVSFGFANTVETSSVPCNCCPVDSDPQEAVTQNRFASASQTTAQAGWNPVGLDQTADGITATTNVTGYNSPAGLTASTTLRVTYLTDGPVNRVRGLRLWNQTGGDLNDSDGIGPCNAEFYAGATLLTTFPFAGVNGGAAQTFLFPGLAELNGVDRVVLRDVGKLSGSTVSPTWREIQLLSVESVWACRRTDGTLSWYDDAGQLVPPGDLIAPAPLATPVFTLRMTGSAFGDGPDALGENICAVTPAPTGTTGFNLVAGGCFDPVVGTPTMDWTNPASVTLEYGNPPHTSGGVFIVFSSPTLGATITWPTNNTDMVIGSQRTSNVFAGNRIARMTYLSGPIAGAPSTNIRMTGGSGGSVISLHVGTTDSTTPPIRFRLDFFTT